MATHPADTFVSNNPQFGPEEEYFVHWNGIQDQAHRVQHCFGALSRSSFLLLSGFVCTANVNENYVRLFVLAENDEVECAIAAVQSDEPRLAKLHGLHVNSTSLLSLSTRFCC